MNQHREETRPVTTLAEQTREVLESFLSSLPEDEQKTVTSSFAKLLESDVADQAIQTGDQAPDFSLPAADGGLRQLSSLLENGPVVLSFYRGGWCPFCNLEFRALMEHLPQIRAAGGSLIGISPETPDTSRATVEKHQLEFEVLSDSGNHTARDYGLVMTVYEEMRPLYLEWGLDIPAANGDQSWDLPVPATYVIDTNRIVRAAFVERDYTRRMEPVDIVSALRELAPGHELLTPGKSPR